MAKVRLRPETNNLYLDFSFRGKRCKEQTALKDTPANRRTLETFANRIKREMAKGTFDYRAFFPDSPRASQFDGDMQATPTAVATRSHASPDRVPPHRRWGSSPGPGTKRTCRAGAKPMPTRLKGPCISTSFPSWVRSRWLK